MKALIIKPEEQSIESIDIADFEEIVGLVGYETVIGDEIGKGGHKLYFDEECFLRGTKGRFQLDKLIPVSGIGVIVGDADGEMVDCSLDIEDIRKRTVFQS